MGATTADRSTSRSKLAADAPPRVWVLADWLDEIRELARRGRPS